jgi:hypothetical protein
MALDVARLANAQHGHRHQLDDGMPRYVRVQDKNVRAFKPSDTAGVEIVVDEPRLIPRFRGVEPDRLITLN